ncbi:MAG: hypothetical protein SGJ21_14850 [Alphaproteobacteria bacterium]|nr:hypothetical protein [Alphaproteobacteria bacterium]
MGRSVLWSVSVFIVFAFATLMVFFWIREGSLEGAGASMDETLTRAGGEIVSTADEVVDSTSLAVEKAVDGDDRT